MTNRQKVVITTAHKLTPTQKSAIMKEVGHKIGQKFELEEVVNPSVVGGLKITLGQKEFDLTIAGRLAQLKSLLPTATVTAAVKLTPDQKKKIKQAIEKTHGSIEYSEVIDEKVIGGIKIRVGSEEYDGTIQTKLDKIKKLLKHQF